MYAIKYLTIVFYFNSLSAIYHLLLRRCSFSYSITVWLKPVRDSRCNFSILDFGSIGFSKVLPAGVINLVLSCLFNYCLPMIECLQNGDAQSVNHDQEVGLAFHLCKYMFQVEFQTCLYIYA